MSRSAQDLDRVRAIGSAPAVRLIRGDAVPLEPVRWLWRGFLPAGMLTILGGAPGCGKTTIALSLAAAISRGGRLPDGSRSDKADVVIWIGEDPKAVTAARLQAADADMSRIHFVDGIDGSEGESFDPGRDMLLLEQTLERLQAPRLLILDPIVSAVSGDSHKGAEVRRSLQPVVDLAQRLRCAVLGITHFSKGTAGRDPVERVTGSIAFAALARVVLVAAKESPGPGDDDGPRRLLVRAKSDVGPDDGGFAYDLERVSLGPEIEGQRVRWLQPLKGSARELLAVAETDAENDDGSTASGVDGFLRGLLADGPVRAKSIKADADGAGYAWRTVQLAATRLGVERRKQGMSGGWVWALDPDPPRRRKAGAEDAEGAARMGPTPSAPSGLGGSCPSAWCKSTARKELRCAVLSGLLPTAEWAQYR